MHCLYGFVPAAAYVSSAVLPSKRAWANFSCRAFFKTGIISLVCRSVNDSNDFLAMVDRHFFVLNLPEILDGAQLDYQIFAVGRAEVDQQSGSAKLLGAPHFYVAHRRDLAMRSNVDFSPFYRSSVGFDRIFNLLENSAQPQGVDKWPPYDIVKLGEDKYRIVIAVPGFTQDDLTITHEPNMLVVKGDKSGDEDFQYLHHGLALRPFLHRFELADHVSVTDARLDNGLLIVELKKEIPEEMKPRRIAISSMGNAAVGESAKRVKDDRAA